MNWYSDIDCSAIDYLTRFYGRIQFMIKSFNKLHLAFVLLLACCFNEVYGQNQYIIEQLPNTVNSLYEEIKPFTSPGGDSLFFIRSYSPENIGGEHAGEDMGGDFNFDRLVVDIRRFQPLGFVKQPGDTH